MIEPVTALEIVVIGDELLSGATVDTNAAHIATELESLGIRVVRKTTVGDDRAMIRDAVAAALNRTAALITSGGLGPTKDDMTKGAVAEVFGRALEFREDLWADLQARHGGEEPVPETNRSQAEVPVGAEAFPNPRGTAPGLAIEAEENLCILLPGVPGELRAILRESVIPFLAERASSSAVKPVRRILRTASVAEARIAELVGDDLDDLPVEVAYLPEVEGVDIRLTYREETETSGPLDEAVDRLRRILGHHIYAEGDADMADVVGRLLRERNLSLALAESCTGGMIAKRLTDYAGSSDFLWAGLVVYHNEAKMKLLGVSEDTLLRHGAVSEQTARELAEGACALAGSDTAIAVTGIAGPGGGTANKPVGTVWLAVRVEGETFAQRRHYAGTRDMVRSRAAQGGLDLLRRAVLQELE